METDNERLEFSIRQTWRGKFILRVRHFENMPHSGEWQDAEPRHLPEFFRRLNGTRATISN